MSNTVESAIVAFLLLCITLFIRNANLFSKWLNGKNATILPSAVGMGSENGSGEVATAGTATSTGALGASGKGTDAATSSSTTKSKTKVSKRKGKKEERIAKAEQKKKERLRREEEAQALASKRVDEEILRRLDEIVEAYAREEQGENPNVGAGVG